MKMIFLGVLMSVMCSLSFAFEVGSNFPEAVFENQHAEAVKVSSETKWLVFVADKDISKVVTEYLNESKFNLDSAKVIYISDISAMPSLITKMVALPKMRKYSFKLALDRTGDVTKSWPKESGKATVVQLDQMKVQQIKYLGTREEVTQFFSNLTEQKGE